MPNVFFARTRYHYDPYQDFWRLVELSGFATCYLDEVDWDADVTVVATPANGEWRGIPLHKRARLIHWNLERCRADMPEGDMSRPESPLQADETWASDRAMAKEIGAKYVFLGGHRAFGSVDFRHKRYDVALLMYMNVRRMPLAHDLKGLTIADEGAVMWGEARHERLTQTRLMVRAHQDDAPWSEPIAWCIGACYALPLLSEQCADSGYWLPGTHYESAPLGWMGERARMLLADEQRLARLGAAAWRLCCVERTFRASVEAALS